jgi:hypothetical protein
MKSKPKKNRSQNRIKKMPKFSSCWNKMKMILSNFKKMVHDNINIAYDERPPEKIKAKQWR